MAGIDFVAPNGICFEAYSPNTFYSNATFNQVQGSNGLYGVQNAVSASAPSYPEEIRTLLQESCVVDSFTEVVPNTSWGYGKRNALQAIQNTLRVTDVMAHHPLNMGLSVYPNPSNERVTFRLENANSTPVALELYNYLGQLVWSKTDQMETQMEESLKGLPAGVYYAVLHFEDYKLSRRLVKSPEKREGLL